jgi:HD superfamily phosphohydrolase
MNEIRDPVYGFIKFNEWEKEIIDHFVFQRLRRIRQLALTDMVYPGAIHTRFEHSLGVMHLATKMYDAITSDNSNKQLLKEKCNYEESGLQKDRQLVRLVALLHDVGHFPFSHASEDILKKNPKTKKHYKHEDYTTALINGPLRDVIENHRINRTNFNITADDISSLIEGNPERLRERFFWKVLISSQLDADRGDYLLRDSLHSGVKYGIYDLDRLLATIALGIDPETKDVILGVKEGGWHVAESLIIARYQMFSQVYFHKTRRAYDHMLQEAIKSTIDTLPLPNEIEDFLKLDDYVMWQNLGVSRQIRLYVKANEREKTKEEIRGVK